MKRAIYTLFAIAALSAALQPAFAKEVWTQGEARIANIVYCKDAKDAEEIAEVYVKEGWQAADAVLQTKLSASVGPGKCASRPAKFIIVKLVSAHKNGDAAVNVVEVEDAAGSGTYYVVNETRVVKAVGGDPKTKQIS